MKIEIGKLKESNDFLNSLYENVTSAIFVANENAEIFSFNNAFKTLFYKPEDEILNQLCGNVIGCIFQQEENVNCGQTSHCKDCILRNSIIKSFTEKVPVYKELLHREFNINKNTIEKYFIFTTKYVIYLNMEMILVVVDDITDEIERKRKLEIYTDSLENLVSMQADNLIDFSNMFSEIKEEKDLLLKEVHHRVKNNLQIISSLINIQQRVEFNESTMSNLSDLETRIEAIKLIYEYILALETKTKINSKKYLSSTILNIPHSNLNSSNFNINIEEIELSIEEAMPLGLIINEILINLSLCKEENTIEVLFIQKDEHCYLDLSCSKKLALGGDSEKEIISMTLIKGLITQLKGEIIEKDTVLFSMFFPKIQT